LSNPNILFEVKNGIGFIRLNRPEKRNALSYPMIECMYKQLLEWKNDDSVAMVLLEGEGDKALCAGGDVVHLREKRYSNIDEYAFGFFYTEYCMNMLIFTYPKPIMSYMTGFVMGGGVGICVGTSHRIVTEKTKWAMPEMNIGLYPDVGGSYFMNKMPGQTGRYLALTSKPIKPADVLYIGAADYYIDTSSWDELRQAIVDKTWTLDGTVERLDFLISQYSKELPVVSPLAELEEKINYHFGFDTMEEIVESLEQAAENGDEWADDVVKTIFTKSPTSLKVTLKQLQEGKKKTMKECFEMELEMSMNFMHYDDFFEGVRAVLVDKDRNPKWNPPSLEEVKQEVVDSFFSYIWEDGKNPLYEFEI